MRSHSLMGIVFFSLLLICPLAKAEFGPRPGMGGPGWYGPAQPRNWYGPAPMQQQWQPAPRPYVQPLPLNPGYGQNQNKVERAHWLEQLKFTGDQIASVVSAMRARGYRANAVEYNAWYSQYMTAVLQPIFMEHPDQATPEYALNIQIKFFNQDATQLLDFWTSYFGDRAGRIPPEAEANTSQKWFAVNQGFYNTIAGLRWFIGNLIYNPESGKIAGKMAMMPDERYRYVRELIRLQDKLMYEMFQVRQNARVIFGPQFPVIDALPPVNWCARPMPFQIQPMFAPNLEQYPAFPYFPVEGYRQNGQIQYGPNPVIPNQGVPGYVDPQQNMGPNGFWQGSQQGGMQGGQPGALNQQGLQGQQNLNGQQPPAYGGYGDNRNNSYAPNGTYDPNNTNGAYDPRTNGNMMNNTGYYDPNGTSRQGANQGYYGNQGYNNGQGNGMYDPNGSGQGYNGPYPQNGQGFDQDPQGLQQNGNGPFYQ